MRMKTSSFAAMVSVIGGLLLAIASGCAQRESTQAQVASNLKPLAVLYGKFTGSHRGRSPENEKEFKDYIKSLSESDLAALKISDAEKLFVSARDGQPYVVVYGGPKGPAGSSSSPVVVYEQVGVGGKRFVATALGAIEEVADARFREMVPDAK